jgi:hypothetical protein
MEHGLLLACGLVAGLAAQLSLRTKVKEAEQLLERYRFRSYQHKQQQREQLQQDFKSIQACSGNAHDGISAEANGAETIEEAT